MHELVERAEATFAGLARDANLAWWDANVDANDEHERRRAETEVAFSNALGDPELFAEVDAAADRGDGDTHHRRLHLLRSAMLPHQIPASQRERIVELAASVEGRFARHRGVVGGEEVDDVAIKRILRESESVAERREAWEASKTVGAVVADDVRELARLRNEAARSLGYRDWFALAVAVSELDEEKLVATLAACDRVTAEPFARWKGSLDDRLAARFDCSTTELRPWHYADPFFQEPPPDGAVDLDPLFRGRDLVELGRRTFAGVGVDVDGTIERSDLFPRARKCQHAFCMDIDRAGDVRVLMNLTDTHDAVTTLLHELGHAAFDLGQAADQPWLFRTPHVVTTEATAILFGSLSSRRQWLEGVLGVGEGEADRLEAELKAARAAELLLFTRWVLVMTGFERRLYADPEADLDAVWWELVSRYQLVTPPDDRRAPDWAAKIHVAVAPVYYHSYLYGAIVALQLNDALERTTNGIVGRVDAGRVLAERLFAPGQSVRWDRLIEQATGSPLSVKSLEREVAAA